LLEETMKAPETADPDKVRAWTEEKKALEEAMCLRSYEWKSFGPGIAVIAPLAVGLISKLLSGAFNN
jgi:hypothetical protein